MKVEQHCFSCLLSFDPSLSLPANAPLGGLTFFSFSGLLAVEELLCAHVKCAILFINNLL